MLFGVFLLRKVYLNMAKNKPQNGGKGLFARIRSVFVGSTKESLAMLTNPNNVNFGVVVNTSAALRFTAVFAAIKILSENIASLPKSVKKKTARGFVDAKDHPAFRVLAVRPNEYQDRFAFWFTLIANVLTKGNGFAVIKFGPDYRVESLHLVDPDSVGIVFKDGKKSYVVDSQDPDERWLNGTYLEHEMIHVMFFTRDGIRGIDPISYNAAAIGRGIATQKFSSEFYSRGGQIKGTLETDESLGDEEYENFMRHYHNASSNFETPLLEYGIKYKPVGIDPMAAQLIQSETLSIDDIARIFSIPPHLLAEMSHATFSNIEQQNIFFGAYSLRPLCKRIEEQLELKLFTSSEYGKFSIKFDLRGLMRGDDAARANYYASGINAGWMTPNEARKEEGLATLPGLDYPRLLVNTCLVDQEGNIINPNTTQTPE